MTKLSNKEIVEKLRKGDKVIFDELFHSHYSALCNYALRFVKRDADAEEAVQHIFVQLWEKREQLKSDIPIKAFLFKSTSNHCLNHIKHLQVRAKYAEEIKATSISNSFNSYEDIEYLELLKRIERALTGLPDRCRAVFLLSRDEELSYKEIASKMDISIKTVEAQMGKALKHLRFQLKDYLVFWVLFFLRL